MRMTRMPMLAAIIASLALAGCGGDDESSTTTPGTPAAEEQGARNTGAAEGKQQPGGGAGRGASGTEIVAAESQYGSILFGPGQRAIYLFDKERSDASECYGACAEAWPPVLTEGDPAGRDGVEAKLLGTTKRDDGSTQVTYNGHPLYYYVDDPPGKVLCHNVEEFGGLWLVVEPSGDAVQ
jgi:predicted lipoprotein with Yx(FWY)xxD motif